MNFDGWPEYLDRPMVYSALCLILLVILITRFSVKGKNAKFKPWLTVGACIVLVIFAGLAFGFADKRREHAAKPDAPLNPQVEVNQTNNGDNGTNVSNSGSGTQTNFIGNGK